MYRASQYAHLPRNIRCNSALTSLSLYIAKVNFFFLLFSRVFGVFCAFRFVAIFGCPVVFFFPLTAGVDAATSGA
jgi:hypothetical protein